MFVNVLNVNADVLGPHPMESNIPTPEGYSKVIVTTSPAFTGGWISLATANGGTIILHGSMTYMPTCYYFIPQGTYQVVEIADRYSVVVNGSTVTEGSMVTFYNGGHIGFTANEEEE